MATDLITSVTAIAGGGSGGGVGRSFALPPAGVSPSASSSLAVQFRAAMNSAAASGVPGATSAPQAMKSMFSALDHVNNQAQAVSEFATTAEASGGQLTPGEIVQLTMRCNEFMFQCQLTSNIANRSSDGLQQLFRQQG